jgi:hypothetical protein
MAGMDTGKETFILYIGKTIYDSVFMVVRYFGYKICFLD